MQSQYKPWEKDKGNKKKKKITRNNKTVVSVGDGIAVYLGVRKVKAANKGNTLVILYGRERKKCNENYPNKKRRAFRHSSKGKPQNKGML